MKLTIDGVITPKARPRVTSNGTYLPPAYRKWKDCAIWQLGRQYNGSTLVGPLSIDIRMIGKHPRRGDADNIAGSILDALVQAKVIRDDNLTVVTALRLAIEYNKKVLPTTEIAIIDSTEAPCPISNNPFCEDFSEEVDRSADR